MLHYTLWISKDLKILFEWLLLNRAVNVLAHTYITLLNGVDVIPTSVAAMLCTCTCISVNFNIVIYNCIELIYMINTDIIPLMLMFSSLLKGKQRYTKQAMTATASTLVTPIFTIHLYIQTKLECVF